MPHDDTQWLCLEKPAAATPGADKCVVHIRADEVAVVEQHVKAGKDGQPDCTCCVKLLSRTGDVLFYSHETTNPKCAAMTAVVKELEASGLLEAVKETKKDGKAVK